MTANEIKQLRKRLKMTQEKLAEKLGVDRTTVARWEIDGKKGQRPSQLAKRQLRRLEAK